MFFFQRLTIPFFHKSGWRDGKFSIYSVYFLRSMGKMLFVVLASTFLLALSLFLLRVNAVPPRLSLSFNPLPGLKSSRDR